ncbi:hypothetical protein FAES_pFAES01097 (plasmid) [Fibrella aestuarina BUZ 2]|uniref:PepSY-associated TM helix domain protein n=1 Tax=Fibrella aestuarina BUZ 2 TaxID=1166018 RepID=I0KHI6_9BACT|nr:hypothetical protein [Fibrella aestuarina]CCH03589.1 hypothetical protein FAES_pFAES01097 [Fibrella aestuarina BUZ 2]
MRRTWHLRIRRTHRYLGLLIGIQFLLWTLGGLYFSWSNLDDIHGDHLKRPVPAFSTVASLVSPAVPLQTLHGQGIDSITSINLIDVAGTPCYQISYPTQQKAGSSTTQTRLADALTGQFRAELTQTEAITLAQQRFAGSPEVAGVEYLTTTNGHHEYREKPLPAYAITFRQPAHATIYVATRLGTVQSVRTDPWRVFDLLWMLHTMDYAGRDDINNGLLRGFSVLGLLTILSGFALYGISSPGFRKRKTLSTKPVTNPV